MMAEFPAGVSALAFDIFGTTVDWWTGMTAHIGELARRTQIAVDPAEITRRWCQEFFTGLDQVRRGQRKFAGLDVIHAEGLGIVLQGLGLDSAFTDADKAELVRGWHSLPAWPDVRAGLAALRSRYTVCALSNGGFAQLTNVAKSADLQFDCVISTEISRHYKPDVEVYSSAAELLDLRPDQILMVAAHGWDLDGARAAGFRTAFVWRPREYGPFPGADAPDQVTSDLQAESFIELDQVLRGTAAGR